jgi:hypothetical protein
MNVGRLVTGIVVILVLYAVISQPLAAAQMTRGGVGQLGVAGDRATQFVMALFGGSVSSAADVTPTGGAAAGDGSSAPRH